MTKKTTKIFLLLFAVFLMLFPTTKILADKEKNPMWEYYQSLTEEEKAKWGVIPEEYTILFSNSLPKFNLPRGSSLIPYFDLRNVDGNNYVTPLKNQSTLGLCWSFASIASVESKALMLGLATSSNPLLFSERQLDYATARPDTAITEGFSYYTNYWADEPRTLGEGGNFYYSADYFARGLSPVMQEGDWLTYNTNLNTQSLATVFNNSNIDYNVTDFSILGGLSVWDEDYTASVKLDYRNKIKTELTQNGAVYIATVSPQYTSLTCSIYDSDNDVEVISYDDISCSANGTHAMNIIGWDDNYSISYCRFMDDGYSLDGYTSSECSAAGGEYKTKTGAWILKNSWGNEASYPYLMYDSTLLEVASVSGVKEKDWDNLYDDSFTNNYEIEYKDEYTAEVTYHKPVAEEKLMEVSVYQYSPESEYNIYYKSNEGASYQLLGTKTPTYAGLFTIDNINLPLTSSSFKIKIVSNNPLLLDGIYAKTKNISSNPTLEINMLSEEVYQSFPDFMEFSISGRNISSSTPITYKVFNPDGTENTTDFTVPNSTMTVTTDFNNIFLNSDDIADKLYILKAYYNGELMDTTIFDPVVSRELAIKKFNSYSINTTLETTTKMLYGAKIKIDVQAKDLEGNISVVIKNSLLEDVTSNFSIIGNTIESETANITITRKNGIVLPTGIYSLKLSVDDVAVNKDFMVTEIEINNTIVRGLSDGIIELEDQKTREEITNLITSSNNFVINNGSNTYVGTGDTLNIVSSDNTIITPTIAFLLRGDVDGDSQIDIYDIISVRKHILTLSSITNNLFLQAANIEQDDDVDIYDIIKIRKKILGM